jgi:hypothetical protein
MREAFLALLRSAVAFVDLTGGLTTTGYYLAALRAAICGGATS